MLVGTCAGRHDYLPFTRKRSDSRNLDESGASHLDAHQANRVVQPKWKPSEIYEVASEKALPIDGCESAACGRAAGLVDFGVIVAVGILESGNQLGTILNFQIRLKNLDVHVLAFGRLAARTAGLIESEVTVVGF